MSERKNIRNQDRERRIRAILEQMTLGEKVHEMSAVTPLWKHAPMVPRYNMWTYDAGGCERLGVPMMRFTDGPRGVTVGRSTCFPVAMARGATFDPDLEERIGEAIGYEARVRGANFFGGVCINLLRHPGWGRAQETYGEDPHHLGVMGAALVTGVQKHVMACIKHFAMNSIEEGRFFVDITCDERTLHEIYLRHFKKCVDAGAAAVMSAYNRCFGEYCGHSRKLLTEILKDQWGFDGFVVSDFLWGVRDGRAAANAGLDIEMPIIRFYGQKLRRLVEAGEVPQKNIDDSVLRILRQKDRFRDVGEKSYDPARVAGRDHDLLALEAARKSIVLLKNDNHVLPLARARLKTIAVIGKLARRANLGDMAARGSDRLMPSPPLPPSANAPAPPSKSSMPPATTSNMPGARPAPPTRSSWWPASPAARKANTSPCRSSSSEATASISTCPTPSAKWSGRRPPRTLDAWSYWRAAPPSPWSRGRTWSRPS